MGSAPFHLPREKYGSPKGTSVFTLNQSLFFSKIGVCFFFKSQFVFFFENRTLFFWKSEFVFWKSEFVFLIGAWLFRKSEVVFFENRSLFFENRSLFFENRSLFFWKSGFDFWKLEFVFFENRSLFWKKSEFVFWKSEYWPQSLCCHSALEFEQNQWQIQGRGRGVRPPFIFRPNWGPKKLFGDRPPPYLRVWMTAPPPPPFPLSEGLYSSFSIKTKSDFQKTNFDFNWNKLRLSINIDVP